MAVVRPAEEVVLRLALVISRWTAGTVGLVVLSYWTLAIRAGAAVAGHLLLDACVRVPGADTHM